MCLIIYQAWTREETDQLFDLSARFDLRFVVIADKLPYSRTVEELKNRYYSGKSANMFMSWSSSVADL